MDIRYIAGLIDADGHITIRKVNARVFVVIVGFTNCYKPVVDNFKIQFGGSVHFMNQAVKKPEHRPTWGWISTGQVANRFVKEVYPHLIVKKYDAELALALQKSIEENKRFRAEVRGSLITPDNVIAHRQWLHDRCKANKHISYYPDTPKAPSSAKLNP